MNDRSVIATAHLVAFTVIAIRLFKSFFCCIYILRKIFLYLHGCVCTDIHLYLYQCMTTDRHMPRRVNRLLFLVFYSLNVTLQTNKHLFPSSLSTLDFICWNKFFFFLKFQPFVQLVYWLVGWLVGWLFGWLLEFVSFHFFFLFFFCLNSWLFATSCLLTKFLVNLCRCVGSCYKSHCVTEIFKQIQNLF